MRHLIECKNWILAANLKILKQEFTRNVEKPNLRYYESGEKDLKEMGLRNW